MFRPCKTLPLHAWHGLLAAWLACGLLWAGPLKIAGSLLIDLDALDFKAGAAKWPQHLVTTGITGDFVARGSPTRQTVAGAEAVVFDGDGDYFIGPITTAALHAAGANHSVEIWVYQGNVREQESVVSWGKRWGPDLTFAGFRYGADPDFGAIARWGSSESGFRKIPPPGHWHHIAYTYDGKYQAVYVDGKLDNSRAVGVMDAHDMLPIHVGAEIGGDLKLEGLFSHYSGALARLRIHSAALTAEEVRNNYDSEIPGFPGLVAKPLQQAPMNRFSFNAAAAPAPDGTTVIDSIGGLTAVIRGADAKFTGGALELPGGSSAMEAYVDLPNGLISARENLTIEFWESQSAPQNWCRIMSIGTNLSGEIMGPGGNFTGSESLTLFGNVGATQVNRFARSFGSYPNGGPDRNPADYPDSDYGVEFQQVITYDKSLQEWQWYRNGVLMEVIPDRLGPTTIPDVNVWLGRSEFSMDSNFQGRFREFRIYNQALSDSEIYGNFLAGPDKISLSGHFSAMNWTPVDPGVHSFANAAGSDNWKTGANGPHPDGRGNTATFASALEGDEEITLESPVTLGTLNLGTRSRDGSFTLRSNKSGVLTMDSGGGADAAITQLPGSPGNFIYAPIVLRSDTEISNQSGNPLVLGGPIGGSGTLIKCGSGEVILSGSGSDHTGAVKIVAGVLVIGDGRATGSLPHCEFTVMAPGQLVLNRDVDSSLEDAICGTGRVVHRGRGQLSLSENSAFTLTGALELADGSGTFTNSGKIDGAATIITDSDLILGGHGTTRLAASLSLGSENGGTLTVRDSATVRIEGIGHLNIGDLGEGQSTMILSGGSVICKQLFIGKNKGMSGVLLQSGGELKKVKQDALQDSRVGGAGGDAYDAWGAWRMTGGTYSDDWNLQIGGFGTGVLEIDGGSMSIAGFLGIGRYVDDFNHPSHGLVDVKSGNISMTGAGTFLLVGEEGVGVLNIRGHGTVTCANKIIIGAGSMKNPGEGTVNLLAGGVLMTGGISQLNQTEAVGRLNFDGGTLVASKAADTFIDGIDAALVNKGGARIDSNGFDVRIPQPLVAPRGKGVVSIPLKNGGSGYVGPPLIDISGGAGSGATATADLVDGSIHSITITHSGSDYLTPPAVRILGGGSGTGFEIGAPVLGANSSGGLVKTGVGTLTLGGENTYTGMTQIEQGGLRIEVGLAGGVKIAAGATFGGSGVIGGALEGAADSWISPDTGGVLAIHGDAAIHGTLSIVAAAAGGGRLAVTGKLDLTGATLSLRSAAAEVAGTSHVIANYGALHGKFADAEAIPPGYTIDYHYDGLNQIALVFAVAKTDGD